MGWGGEGLRGGEQDTDVFKLLILKTLCPVLPKQPRSVQFW